MNLNKLFETQKVLDTRIEKEHPKVDSEDRLAKKILALQVELGELANEWRGFKFWSNDQEPRTFGLKLGRTSKENRYINPLLEEYVDCLHFILSIGLEIEVFNITAFESLLKFGSNPNREVLFVYSKLFNEVGMMGIDDKSVILEYYPNVFQWFLELGCLLGLTWEQIEQAYYEKNEVNHERQNTGY
ncbi:MAG: dUTP diphosphatase [Psychrobacillus psychrodurans]